MRKILPKDCPNKEKKQKRKKHKVDKRTKARQSTIVGRQVCDIYFWSLAAFVSGRRSLIIVTR